MSHSISKSLSICLLPIFLVACSSNSNKEESKSMIESSNLQSGIQQEEISQKDESFSAEFKKTEQSVQQQKLIKTGELTLKSKHIEKSKTNLDKVLKQVGGYYDNESFSKSNYELRYSLQLRIPSAKFDQLLQSINTGSDEILAKNIHAEDVGEEYHDIETRLKSKKAYLKRYQEITINAKNVDDLLQIENQIRQLIEEIESQEGRLRFLDNQVGYGTLNIELFKTLSRPPVLADENSFWEDAGNSLSTGWAAIVGFVLSLLSIWPLLLILIPASMFGYRKVKIYLKKENKQ